MRKYRFLVLGILLRIATAYLSSEVYYYHVFNYSLPSNFIQLIISLLIVLSDLNFLIDSIFYYLTIKDVVCLRIDKQRYYQIVIKNILYAFILLLLIQIMIPFIWFNVFLFKDVFVYTFLLVSMFCISFSIKNNIHENMSVIILTIIITVLKFIIFN